MARICPKCTQENYDQSVFCTRCGFRFIATEDVPTPAIAPNLGYSGYVQPASVPTEDVPPSFRPGQSTPAPGQTPFMPFGDPAYGQQGGMRSGYNAAPTSGDPYGAPGGSYQPQQQQGFANMPPPQQGFANMPPPQGGQYPPYAAPRAPGQGLAVVQRAFAGKGVPLMHASWLVNSKDDKEVSAADIRTAIIEKVQKRFPNELKASQEHLSERDAVMEERDYVRIERAPANVFVYATSFGRDLYISRTTTVQPSFSLVRIAVLGLLLVLMLIVFIVSSVSGAPTFTGQNVTDYISNLAGFIQFKLVLSLISTSLLIFFIVLVLRSAIHWVTNKDFLFYLRPRVLNDFRVDDGAILEHIADRGIREAVEELGLDVSALATPARSYPVRQPLF